ncbi:MAG: cation:dicarboxylase symporter family transporter, partial [Acinetobacter calcoaceticus]
MKSISLVWQILIGLLLGILVGWYFNVNPTHQVWVSTEILKPLGDIFINMMKMVVVPIVLCCMILGIAGGGDNKSFGKMGAGSLLYFFTITSLAIVWGLLLANFFQPGVGTDISGMAHSAVVLHTDTNKGALQIIKNIVPENIV